MSEIATSQGVAARDARRRQRNYARSYWPFLLPAAVLVGLVILFPWAFTLFMSVEDFHPGSAASFVGIANYAQMLGDDRFLQAILHTVYFTVLAVVLPTVLGVAAALVFHKRFPLRGLARTIFILPMMATPVAIALVWTMMFHPQLGVLNYLLTSVGLPPSSWVYNANTVIPTLAMVETWQWTPLVMLIVLGGLASLPSDPYEAAVLDGAGPWASFRHVTLPLVWPFILVAVVLRAVDALKSFDIIFVISGGGPGTASETLNVFLYQQAFAYYNIGYASAVVVVFFILIMAITVFLLRLRREESAA